MQSVTRTAITKNRTDTYLYRYLPDDSVLLSIHETVMPGESQN